MNVLRYIWQDRKARIYLIIMLLLLVISLLAPWLAADHDIAVIPFSPTEVSVASKSYQPPGFQEVSPVTGNVKTHLLGTDQIGRDVAARIIHGIPTALMVGIGSTLISLLIALILGLSAGFYAGNRPQIRIQSLLLFIFAIIPILFYVTELSYVIDQAQGAIMRTGLMMISTLSGILLTILLLHRLPTLIKGTVSLPVDAGVLRLLEVFNSIPKLFLLLAIYAFITIPSLLSVIIIIGMLRWGTMTRLLRAEVIRVKEENFIQAATAIGLSNCPVIWRHILPNVLGPIIIACSFSIGSAILVESTLSFLQIGLPLDQVSWGQMLAESRMYFPAWWLAVPPGLMIFLIILLCNSLGSRIGHILESNRR